MTATAYSTSGPETQAAYVMDPETGATVVDPAYVYDDRDRFARLSEWVLDADISDKAVRLYAVLDRYAGAGGTAYPSRQRLADRMRCSVDTVDRAMKELVTIGAIEVVKRFRDDGGYRASNYRLLPQPRRGREPQNRGSDRPQGRGLKKESQKEGEKTNTEAAPEGAARPQDELPPEAENPDARRLAELMADTIATRGMKRPTVTQAWVRDMDRLIRIDKRKPARVETVIRWLASGTDSVAAFWRANVRSPAKLREKWDQMGEQYQERVKPKALAGPPPPRRLTEQERQDQLVRRTHYETLLRLAGDDPVALAGVGAPDPDDVEYFRARLQPRG